jgi:bifunctional N-acetylglucosamine-1-phosphate-uridyltransferase/glucosamine-1-phosphate-acetyltransferase GlmU-like protein
MLDFLEPCYGHLVFVLSPEGHEDVTGELNKLIPGRFEVVIQHTPTGMGDAVALALPHVKTPHVTVVWGDQVTLQRSSVEACQKLHEGPLRPDLTCPTVWRANPYIPFDRDQAGNINGLRQAREGDHMPPQGESDTGFFCFETTRLADLLGSARSSAHGSGTRTGEFNLLPVIPVAARQGVVLTPHLMSMEETQGINSGEDAVAVADFLRRSHGGGHQF